MTEENWTDKFGEHFEVRQIVAGRLYSRKITKCPIRGWTISWDEARASVREAIAKDQKSSPNLIK